MLARICFLGLVCVCVGCRDLEGPATGEILASISTTTDPQDRDANGYILQVEGRDPHSVPINSVVTIGPLEPGTYRVRLDGLAPNCSVNGPNPVTVDVDAGQVGAEIARINFLVSCVPRVGSIRVSTVTSGSDPDPDGYGVQVAGASRGAIPANGVQTITGVRDGVIGVTLTGLTGNCAIEPPSTKTVTVVFGATTEVAFAVQCVPGGSVTVTTTIDNPAELNPSGYELELRGLDASPAVRVSAPPAGTIRFTGLRPGTYFLSVLELVPHCDPVFRAPLSLSVTAGSVTEVTVEISCSAPAVLAFVSDQSGNRDISTVSSKGVFTRLTTDLAPDLSPAWSPDGSRIAFATSRDGNFEIYVMNANGENPVRLTNHPASDRTPAWSPDGTRIAFASERDGNLEIYVMNADGTNPVRLTTHVESDADPAWSPDGSAIAFTSYRETNSGVWVMNPDGSNLRRITSGNFADSQPAWSPDSKRIAVSVRQNSFANAINLINVDGSGRVAVTSYLEEASNPAWSPDGRKLVYTAFICDFYRYYCDPYLAFVGVAGTQYSWAIPGRISDAAWQPGSGR